MNWEAIGAVGEIVGALAVVFSLIYLATQIRVQNTEAKVASVHDIKEAYRQTIAGLLDKEIAEIHIKALDDTDSLTDVERLRLIALYQSMYRVWEEAFFQWTEGRLDDRHWKGISAVCMDFISTKAGQEFWSLRKHAYSDDFVSYVSNQEPGNYRLK